MVVFGTLYMSFNALKRALFDAIVYFYIGCIFVTLLEANLSTQKTYRNMYPFELKTDAIASKSRKLCKYTDFRGLERIFFAKAKSCKQTLTLTPSQQCSQHCLQQLQTSWFL